MLDDIAYPIFNRQPHSDWAAYELGSSFGRKRVFLVAIQGEECSPFSQGIGPLQRVHLMMVRPGETIEFDSPLSVLSPLPEFPMLSPYGAGGRLAVRPQQVRGEILRDASGQLYEKLGTQIHPLHQLASGPQGEVLNLPPRAGRGNRADAAVTGQSSASRSEIDTPPAVPTYRNLFPEPGQWRLVKLGEFNEILGPQLAHPDRLRPNHRLACCLQIYEVLSAQSLETVASALDDGTPAVRLYPLSDEAAKKLGVASLIPTRGRVPAGFRREAGRLLPGDCAFRLRLENDPTRDIVNPDTSPPREDDQRETSSSPEARAGTKPGAKSRGLKKAIPKRFLKPWEFQSSYEEVLDEVKTEASSGWVRSTWARLKSGLSAGKDFRKWQILLRGKSLEEQLWGVRPPRGGLSDPVIRDWARKTLELAGYDSRTMLLEWEIFWRRKGF